MSQEKYNHIEVERKWQTYWKENQLFKAKVDPSKPKYYILDMFPYPSGAGLHVGHVTGYTATDILARYKRQKGYNVLHPMGWDSFGLQAEQYAVRTGTHPKITTEKNINTYRRQLQSLGFSYDWDREFATSDPDYYKWTQWIFSKLYEQGLAYEAEILVNYCPALGTVLANEEVENGKSREGGYPVERRPLRQWILKITAYAERLLADLETLDWPEYLKILQRNWIGKSEGAEVVFLENESKQPITVFTTRHDTLFGTTFLVLSPEHPLVNKITTDDQKEDVEAYQQKTTAKSDMERTDLNKEKSGVWTGAYARNPINNELIPIWIADYVLMGYGTGAVMAVPGGDERDFEFAKKFGLKIIPPYDPLLKDYLDDLPADMAEEDFRLEILAGNRCWTKGGVVINGKSELFDINGLEIEAAKNKVADWLETHKCGRRTTTYKLRDWLFSRQRYWGEPFPILHLEDGTKRLLDLDELPLVLPELTDYKPQGEGRTPLENVPEWVEITDPKTGKKALRETNTMPQWAGSCWYYLRFCDPHNENAAWGEKEEKYWMPVDMYVGGVEHAVLHLLYARFWHKVLYDLDLVSTTEPFQTLRNQGLVTARAFKRLGGGYVDAHHVMKKGDEYFEEGGDEKLLSLVEKMSKSKLNGVTPDEIVQELGADSLRLYEMFMGPFDKEKLWNSEAISGCRRFLDRFFQLVTSDKVIGKEEGEGMKLAHILVKGVENDIESMLYNTAISKMMEFVNAFVKLDSYPKKALQMAVQALSPFAPHLAEECWEILGKEPGSLTFEPYPQADPKYLEEASAVYVVQINGKFRGKWELPKGQSQDELLEFVKGEEKIAKHLQGEIMKVIFVPDKLINLVVKP
ncbi:leucine--tRNA ligase [Simkania negevensis]|uniref:Leucine--tRNA ligase n=1 Tax=Simkania negevensis (strain ATCC VR-1471 / DSM 27360 / Z) TaxID=331113 RepID=F8L8J9_SIMNZ|nr:leucine--tRNA ligase [Simkania negevensis]CCB89131.1 leucyl-tRNA synthetase [Simkania negevensis Z]